MQANETTSNTTSNSRQSHASKFTRVFDGRKQPIRGLWIRNDRYYAQLSFETDTGEKVVKRVPLLNKDQSPVASRAEAVKAMEALKTKREENTLPVLARTPRFSDYV